MNPQRVRGSERRNVELVSYLVVVVAEEEALGHEEEKK